MTTTSEVGRIREPRQIRALASVPRQEIFDALQSEGACTVRRLGELLGKPADTLYYHIRLLQKVGLVREIVDVDGVLLFDLIHPKAKLAYDPSDKRNRTAVQKVVRKLLRNAERRFVRAFAPEIAVVEGDERNLWAGNVRGSLNAAQLREVNHHIKQILRIMRRARSKQSGSYDFTYVLTPNL